MLLVAVASKNPAKIASVNLAFQDIFGPLSFQIESVNVSINAPEQPIGNEQTRECARLRVESIRQRCPEADFWVGIEAGVDEGMTFAWIVIENLSQRGESRSAGLPLPAVVLEEIEQGKELADIMVNLTRIPDIRSKGGAISVFSAGKLSRTSVYHQALVLALSPFHNAIYLT